MRYNGRIIFITAVFLFWSGTFAPPGQASAFPDLRDAMVKIYTVQSRPDYDTPWNMHAPRSSSASGCIIDGERILTNAHAVADQTFIQVRRHGSAKKLPARVLAVSHEADLALLTVDAPDFFAGIHPLEFGELPEAQEEVLVYGFPRGGDTLSTTRGVMSRIEHRFYAHSSRYLLAGQLDAAVNPGNSGGPVMKGDRIVGVVMQSIRSADNIGYMVPVPVVKHFLDDIGDGRYDGFPAVGIAWQTMENRGFRWKYGLKQGQSGVWVKAVVPGSPAEGILERGDVIVAIDGHDVADDGTVEFRAGERTSLSYFIQGHQVGDALALTVLRGGTIRDVEISLDKAIGSMDLVPMERYDVRPSYYIYGGLVFSPLTKNYLMTWGNRWYDQAPKHLVALLRNNRRTVTDEEVVLLLGVLPSEVNQGYHSFGDLRITTVNGKKINRLSDLIRQVEADAEDPYVVFGETNGAQIVLDRKAVAEAEADLLKTYRVSADRSADLGVPRVTAEHP